LAQKNNGIIDLKDAEGNTALNLAVIHGNTRIVRRLLIAGADRYIRDNNNKTPLDIALESKYKTIDKMLD
jgi:palmitoyltransferase